MNLIASPSAMLLMLGLGAIVLLQIIGDIQQSILHVKRPKKSRRPVRITYLPAYSLSAGLRASQYVLSCYKQRATQEKRLQFNPTSNLRASWPLSFSAVSLLLMVGWLEGFMAACLLILLYLGLMTVVGLLAWPLNAKESFSDKLAIALLAPYAVFVRFD